MKLIISFLFGLCCSAAARSQPGTTADGLAGVFNQLSGAASAYRLDTSAVPRDRVTAAIIELRKLRGGFNINEVIQYKLEEEKSKVGKPDSALQDYARFMKTGKGKEWLDRAMIWIYRKHFTYQELQQLISFYKTTAGRKMAADFPVIIVQSLTAVEKIKDLYTTE